ncbi:MAG TPA: CPXCG motif-containing cysteine-rich protein [Xanthomonadaceae bacterium]|nr:CPXCG motif-containing cysteine-rich protein [Xanthomonadaceae bacterium]
MPWLPSAAVRCPYCGERIELLVDESAGAQAYTEDCPVCCRPIAVAVDGEAGEGGLRVEARSEHEA